MSARPVHHSETSDEPDVVSASRRLAQFEHWLSGDERAASLALKFFVAEGARSGALEALAREVAAANRMPLEPTDAAHVRIALSPEVTPSDPQSPQAGHREDDPPARRRKLSISLPADVESELRERAGKGDVSGYIAEAVRQRLEADRLADLIHWLREENGQVPEDVQAEVDSEWPAAE